MIHYKKEGQALALGLNITVGVHKRVLPWITFIWAWYTPETTKMKSWRLRFRTWHPAIFWSVNDWDVIESYLRQFDMRLITRELIEDLRLHAYCQNDKTLDRMLDRYKLPKNYD